MNQQSFLVNKREVLSMLDRSPDKTTWGFILNKKNLPFVANTLMLKSIISISKNERIQFNFDGEKLITIIVGEITYNFDAILSR